MVGLAIAIVIIGFMYQGASALQGGVGRDAASARSSPLRDLEDEPATRHEGNRLAWCEASG